MIKNLKSNWRELVALIVVNSILFSLLLALGTVNISESGPLSTLVSLVTTLIGGASKFSMVITLMWFGLAVTFPEAAKFLLGNRFDSAWEHCTDHGKLTITLSAVAALALVAALCMASS